MQILQPGDVPAWAGDDPASTIADIFANDTWPALWPRLFFSFASTGARDAALAGLGPSDRAFAFIENLKCLQRWSGTAWVLAAPWVQGGTATTPSLANGASTTIPITYPVAFTSTPRVMVSGTSGRIGYAVGSATTTGCSLILDNWSGGTASAGALAWTATQVP